MSNKRTCPECQGIVVPFKRGVDPDVALYNHIRLSHPGAKIALVIPSSTLPKSTFTLTDLQPTTTGATQP